LRDVFVQDPAEHEDLIDRLKAAGVPVWTVGTDVIKALTETITPQGVVAVASNPTVDLGSVQDPKLVVLLADVRDPGNAGTLIRSALAAGASAIVFAKGSVDPLHPKVARSAASAVFGLPVIRGIELEQAIDGLRSAGLTMIGTSASAPSMYESDLTTPVTIVLGNEAWGLAPEIEALMDVSVGIPMPGPAESLNVSVAGSVLLFEALRQRSQNAESPQAPGLSSATND
jgi:RNA methyltransferase, TrmH family